MLLLFFGNIDNIRLFLLSFGVEWPLLCEFKLVHMYIKSYVTG